MITNNFIYDNLFSNMINKYFYKIYLFYNSSINLKHNIIYTFTYNFIRRINKLSFKEFFFLIFYLFLI